MKPLTQLTKKNEKWKWEEKEQKAFCEIKNELIKERLLRTFNPKKKVIIDTDISDHTITEALSQEEQPMKFISHKMNIAEQNYTITEKEMLTIMQAIKEWRRYLEKAKETGRIRTDHKNLTYFQDARITNRRQARWAFEIQKIPFKLEYIKGKDNTIVDIITRRKDATEKLEPRKIFLQIMSIEKTKKRGYHLFMEISEVKKRNNQWKYRRRKIVETMKEKEKLIKRFHDNL